MTDNTARAALAVVDSALAFWNKGHGHADKAWVERMAYNMAEALNRAHTALLASPEAQLPTGPTEGEHAHLRQVIADAFFSFEAGESWQAGGYSRPEPNGGDDALAADILAAGYRLAAQPPTEPTDAEVEAVKWAIARARFVNRGIDPARAEQIDADNCEFMARAALAAPHRTQEGRTND